MANTGSTQRAITPEQIERPARQRVGVLIADPAYRRLLEGIVVNLDLEPTLLEDADFSGAHATGRPHGSGLGL